MRGVRREVAGLRLLLLLLLLLMLLKEMRRGLLLLLSQSLLVVLRSPSSTSTAAPRPRPLPQVPMPLPVNRAQRTPIRPPSDPRPARFADADRPAVKEETGRRVGAEKESALHVGLFGEADEAVAPRETGRGVAHDLGRLGRREERSEESLRGSFESQSPEQRVVVKDEKKEKLVAPSAPPRQPPLPDRRQRR